MESIYCCVNHGILHGIVGLLFTDLGTSVAADIDCTARTPDGNLCTERPPYNNTCTVRPPGFI